MSGAGRGPGGAQFNVDRIGPVREGAEAFGQHPRRCAAGRTVGRGMVIQGFHEPGPGDRAEHFVIAHFGLQLGADVRNNPELPVPDGGTVGIVQQDEAAGGQLDVVAPRSRREGGCRRTVDGSGTSRVSWKRGLRRPGPPRRVPASRARESPPGAIHCGTVLFEGFPGQRGNLPEPGRVRSQWKIMQRGVGSPAGSPPGRVGSPPLRGPRARA